MINENSDTIDYDDLDDLPLSDHIEWQAFFQEEVTINNPDEVELIYN